MAGYNLMARRGRQISSHEAAVIHALDMVISNLLRSTYGTGVHQDVCRHSRRSLSSVARHMRMADATMQAVESSQSCNTAPSTAQGAQWAACCSIEQQATQGGGVHLKERPSNWPMVTKWSQSCSGSLSTFRSSFWRW